MLYIYTPIRTLLCMILIVLSIKTEAQIPSGYTLLREASGVKLYYSQFDGYVHVIDLAKGASIESILGKKEGNFYINNTSYPKYKKHLLNDFWNDWTTEKGTDAFSVINGSFYASDTTNTAAISFPIKHRGAIKTIGFGNNEPFIKRMLKLKNGRAEIIDYDGTHSDSVKTDPATDIIVGLEIGQKHPIFPLRRTAVGVGGSVNDDGYSTIYLLTSAPISATKVSNILQDFGAVQAMAFDGHLSTQIGLGGYSMFTIDRPVPHAIGIAAAPVKKTYFIKNDDILPICGTTTPCLGAPFIGGVIQTEAITDGDEITFEVSKCNGTAFTADGVFYIREDICDDEENYLVGGSYSSGQMSFKATAKLPSYFQTACKTYHVVILPGGKYVTGGIDVCFQSIASSLPDRQSSNQVIHNLINNPYQPLSSSLNAQVSPNPAQGKFSVNLATPTNTNITVELYNSMGIRILTKELIKGASTLLLNQEGNLSSGVYFLTLTIQGKTLQHIRVIIR